MPPGQPGSQSESICMAVTVPGACPAANDSDVHVGFSCSESESSPPQDAANGTSDPAVCEAAAVCGRKGNYSAPDRPCCFDGPQNRSGHSMCCSVDASNLTALSTLLPQHVELSDSSPSASIYDGSLACPGDPASAGHCPGAQDSEESGRAKNWARSASTSSPRSGGSLRFKELDTAYDCLVEPARFRGSDTWRIP